METRTLYHGTVAHAAKEILKFGLRPNPERAFKVNTIPVPCSDCVYLGSELQAKVFARFRQQYDLAHPGENIEVSNELGYFRMYKWPSAQQPELGLDETPTVLKFQVPNFMSIELDPDSLDSDVYRHHGIVPVRYITQVNKFVDGNWKEMK